MNCPVANVDKTQTVSASLFDLFFASSAANADRPALWVDGGHVSYAELRRTAARLAGAINAARGAGLARGETQCGVLANRSLTAYAGVLASLMAGSAYAPLNPKFPIERLRAILSASMIDTLIVDARSAEVVLPLVECFDRPLTVLSPDLPAPVEWIARAPQHRFVSARDIENSDPAAARPESSANDGAYLLFTSGSTGAPKGVLVSHANALTYIENVRERFQPTSTDRFSQLFDFSFDLSVHDMFLAWSAGACVCCIPEGALVGISDFIRKQELTFWLSVPSTAAFMRQMRMLKPGCFPSLRWSLFCGEALPVALARSWQAAASNSTVENLYGPTEATIAFTAYRLPSDPCAELDNLETVPIGTPLPGQRTMLIDDCGYPVREGEAGELCLGGSQVAGGYWRNAELTAARFKPPHGADEPGLGWYRTGDLAVDAGELGLVFRGRLDRQTKIRGHRVELLEVENAMRSAAATDSVAVIAWPVSDGGLALGLVGFVSGSGRSPADIIEKCRERLPLYMVPDEVREISRLPLNANGKTDYGALKTLLEK